MAYKELCVNTKLIYYYSSAVPSTLAVKANKHSVPRSIFRLAASTTIPATFIDINHNLYYDIMRAIVDRNQLSATQGAVALEYSLNLELYLVPKQ